MVRNCDYVLSHSCPPVVSNQDPCSALYSIIECVFLASIVSYPSIPLLLSGPSLLQSFLHLSPFPSLYSADTPQQTEICAAILHHGKGSDYQGLLCHQVQCITFSPHLTECVRY